MGCLWLKRAELREAFVRNARRSCGRFRVAVSCLFILNPVQQVSAGIAHFDILFKNFAQAGIFLQFTA